MEQEKEVCVGPEGLEEAIQLEWAFRVTLTQGERYRIYVKSIGRGARGEYEPQSKCYVDFTDAKKQMGELMSFVGLFVSDPKKTVELMIKGFEKRPE